MRSLNFVLCCVISLVASSHVFAVNESRVSNLREYEWPLNVSWEKDYDELKRDTYLGVFVEKQISSMESYTAVRPFGYAQTKKDDSALRDISILYPIYNYKEYSDYSEWNLMYLFRGGRSTLSSGLEEGSRSALDWKYFELFPFYFNHESHVDYDEYFALFPIYGELKNRFFYDRISWVTFPFYSKWEKSDEITYAYLWPFIKYRVGPRSKGFSLWPLLGSFERKDDYHYRYCLWPLLYFNEDNLDSATPSSKIGILPFYARESRQGYLSEHYLWPFFGYTNDSVVGYDEVRFLWPLFIQRRGQDRYLNQIAPLYSFSRKKGVESKWILWPLFNYRKSGNDDLITEKYKFLYFLYQDTKQSVEGDSEKELGVKRHLWPFFSYWKDQSGAKQFQMFSPLEPLFQSNSKIRRLYSPLFSIFRYEAYDGENKNLELLFSLIQYQRRTNSSRLEFGPLFGYENGEGKFRLEILKGLLGFRNEEGRRSFRLFWFRIGLGVESSEKKMGGLIHE